MSNIDTLVEQLGKLTVVEAGELAKKLEKTWGLDLNAIMSTPAPVEWDYLKQRILLKESLL